MVWGSGGWVGGGVCYLSINIWLRFSQNLRVKIMILTYSNNNEVEFQLLNLRVYKFIVCKCLRFVIF